MSSSNRVQITAIAETVLGETPVTGDFFTARLTGESLSGTPTTTESAQIRSDRLSSGQVITGLEITGDINDELSKDTAFEEFIESAMFNTWQVQAIQTVDLTLAIATVMGKRVVTIERASGDWAATLSVGDIITLAGFTNTENNTQFQVLEIESALIIRVVANEAEGEVVAEVATGTTYKRADKLEIGTTKKSFSIQKAFLDLTEKALIYKGMLVNTFNLAVAYGSVVTSTFGFLGTERLEADEAAEFITDGRTVTPPTTTNVMNGSVDMPFISTSALGDLEPVDFCIQNLELNLNNNMTPQTCIGRIGPKDQSEGQASVTVSLGAYLSDETWGILAKKLNQEPFAIGFMLRNIDGAYGFYMPAVQVSFPDPSAPGANQDITLAMEGTAKVGPNGEKSFIIYRI